MPVLTASTGQPCLTTTLQLSTSIRSTLPAPGSVHESAVLQILCIVVKVVSTPPSLECHPGDLDHPEYIQCYSTFSTRSISFSMDPPSVPPTCQADSPSMKIRLATQTHRLLSSPVLSQPRHARCYVHMPGIVDRPFSILTSQYLSTRVIIQHTPWDQIRS